MIGEKMDGRKKDMTDSRWQKKWMTKRDEGRKETDENCYGKKTREVSRLMRKEIEENKY